MSTRYRTLDCAQLRSDLERHAFASPPQLRDAFALEIEVFAMRGACSGSAPRRIALDEALDGRRSLLEIVRAVALELGCAVLAPGDGECGLERPTELGSFAFGHGGQVRFRSSACAAPARAFEECAACLDELAAVLAPLGVELVSIGADPWSDAGAVGLQDTSATAQCVDAVLAAEGAIGARLLRLGAATRVYVGFGGAVLAPLRFRAARALAPLAGAAFAFSPLHRGASSGHASVRGLWRRSADASRACFSAANDRPPVDAYLEFALDARVQIVRAPLQWFPQLRPFTFRQWLEHGLGGEHPDLDDWRFHLATLDPDVRADGWLALDVQDAQARPFWSVPLVFWSALLEDRSALARAPELCCPEREVYACAARAGLCDPLLGARARAAFALAADALLRRPAGWVSNEMLAAFVGFGQRFVFQGRSPADELLESFAANRRFELDVQRELVAGWSRLAGHVARQAAGARAG